jgi:hypothetical protein
MRKEIPIGGRVLGFSLIVEDGGTIRRLGVAISTWKRGIRDWTPFFKDLERELRATEIKQFSSEGGISRKWDKLTPEYAEAKRRKFGNRKILVASGLLRNAMTKPSHPHALRVMTDDQFAYGSQGVEYARPHQNGYMVRTKAGARKVPARRPIDWDDGFSGRVAGLLRRHANRTARSAGLRTARSGPVIRGNVVPRKGHA